MIVATIAAASTTAPEGPSRLAMCQSRVRLSALVAMRMSASTATRPITSGAIVPNQA